MRQMEVGRCREGRGGKGVQFGYRGIEQQGQEKVSIKPSPGQIWVFGGQPIDVQNRLQTLEGEFDLPAQPIQGAKEINRKLCPLQGSQQDDVIGAGEGSHS